MMLYNKVQLENNNTTSGMFDAHIKSSPGGVF